MCGFVGCIGPKVNKERCLDALEVIKHRGPDATEIWQDNSIWLGHVRLSIIDPVQSSNQPMHSIDKRYTIVFNGEIYNYLELKEQLIILGHSFSTQSDTEVLLYSYVEWGPGCLNKLTGMFAFSIWDNKKNKLFAARDPAGMKPYYYFVDSFSSFSFGSEADALARLKFSKLDASDVSLHAVSLFFSLGYVPAPYSIWKGINKLEAGSFLIWSSDVGAKTYRYWEPPKRILYDKSASDRVDEFSELFERIVAGHTVSDVGFGTFLSSGLDSSAITTACKKSNVDQITAYTVKIVGGAREESEFASKIAKELGVNHIVVDIDSFDVSEKINDTLCQLDEPIGYSAILSSSLLCERASNSEKVFLTGDGGDEVFGGYDRYRDLKKNNNFFAWLARRGYSSFKALGANRINYNKYVRKIQQQVFRAQSHFHGHIVKTFPRFLPFEVEYLISEACPKFCENGVYELFERYDASELPIERRLQRIDLMTYSADLCCAKIDRSAMRYGIELRSPFLDKELIKFGIGSPLEESENIRGKQVVSKYLTCNKVGNNIGLSKRGFSVPLANRLDWSHLLDAIDDSIAVKQGLINKNWRTLATPLMANIDRVWVIYSFSKWLDAKLQNY